MNSGGYFNFEESKERLEEVQLLLAEPDAYQKDNFIDLGKELSELQDLINTLNQKESLQELLSLLEMSETQDELNEIQELLEPYVKSLEELELNLMFCNPNDDNNCFLEIQAGSGGTEAQDFANMLLRMYLRFLHSEGFQAEIISIQGGENADKTIKNAVIHITGERAYGYLRTETGVHRLVRKSPFDANNKRHTSFASVYVTPEIQVNNSEKLYEEKDLRIDTFRASGAGGQHVNKTDSAIRITHIPTNTVVQCQSSRSQHQNRANAYKQLNSKLHELKLQEESKELQEIEDSKLGITWGSQIRSYVLDESRIKDLRTNIVNHNTQDVLDGCILEFILGALKISK